MSVSEFYRWLEIAGGDGTINKDEENALLDRALALGLDRSSAILLIEQRRQRAAIEPPKCPACNEGLSPVEVVFVCPSCGADIGSVKARQKDVGGVVNQLNKAEDAIAALASLHIPKALKSDSPLHKEFTQLQAQAERAVSQLETRYKVNPIIAEMSGKLRAKLVELDTRYQAAIKNGSRRIVLPIAVGLMLLGGGIAFFLYNQTAKESRSKDLYAEFNRLIDQKKYDSAMDVYQTMRSEQVAEAYREKVFVRGNDTTRIPELLTIIMNRKAIDWLDPIVSKLEKYSDGGPYDSCYVLLKKIDSEWRSYPTTTDSDDGLVGDDNTMKVISEVREVIENRMFDYELQNGKITEALRILSKVTDSSRRKAMLAHALEYLKETNRPNDAAQVSALLGR
jgi:hypothetical protein